MPDPARLLEIKSAFILELAKQARREEIFDQVEQEKERLLEEVLNLSPQERQLLQQQMQFSVKDVAGKKAIQSMDKRGQMHSIETEQAGKTLGIRPEDQARVQAAMEKILKLKDRLEEASIGILGEDGLPQQVPLFDEDDIRTEFFDPLVREGLMPDNLVPAKYSTTQRLTDNAMSSYQKTLAEKEREGREDLAAEDMLLGKGGRSIPVLKARLTRYARRKQAAIADALGEGETAGMRWNDAKRKAALVGVVALPVAGAAAGAGLADYFDPALKGQIKDFLLDAGEDVAEGLEDAGEDVAEGLEDAGELFEEGLDIDADALQAAGAFLAEGLRQDAEWVEEGAKAIAGLEKQALLDAAQDLAAGAAFLAEKARELEPYLKAGLRFLEDELKRLGRDLAGDLKAAETLLAESLKLVLQQLKAEAHWIDAAIEAAEPYVRKVLQDLLNKLLQGAAIAEDVVDQAARAAEQELVEGAAWLAEAFQQLEPYLQQGIHMLLQDLARAGAEAAHDLALAEAAAARSLEFVLNQLRQVAHWTEQQLQAAIPVVKKALADALKGLGQDAALIARTAAQEARDAEAALTALGEDVEAGADWLAQRARDLAPYLKQGLQFAQQELAQAGRDLAADAKALADLTERAIALVLQLLKEEALWLDEQIEAVAPQVRKVLEDLLNNLKRDAQALEHGLEQAEQLLDQELVEGAAWLKAALQSLEPYLQRGLQTLRKKLAEAADWIAKGIKGAIPFVAEAVDVVLQILAQEAQWTAAQIAMIAPYVERALLAAAEDLLADARALAGLAEGAAHHAAEALEDVGKALAADGKELARDVKDVAPFLERGILFLVKQLSAALKEDEAAAAACLAEAVASVRNELKTISGWLEEDIDLIGPYLEQMLLDIVNKILQEAKEEAQEALAEAEDAIQDVREDVPQPRKVLHGAMLLKQLWPLKQMWSAHKDHGKAKTEAKINTAALAVVAQLGRSLAAQLSQLDPTLGAAVAEAFLGLVNPGEMAKAALNKPPKVDDIVNTVAKAYEDALKQCVDGDMPGAATFAKAGQSVARLFRAGVKPAVLQEAIANNPAVAFRALESAGTQAVASVLGGQSADAANPDTVNPDDAAVANEMKQLFSQDGDQGEAGRQLVAELQSKRDDKAIEEYQAEVKEWETKGTQEFERELTLIDDEGADLAEQRSVVKLIEQLRKGRKLIAWFAGLTQVATGVEKPSAQLASDAGAQLAEHVIPGLKILGVAGKLLANLLKSIERWKLWWKFRQRLDMAKKANSALQPAIQNFCNNQKEQVTILMLQNAVYVAQIVATSLTQGVVTFPVGIVTSIAVTGAQAFINAGATLYGATQLKKAWETTRAAIANPNDRKLGLEAQALNPSLAMHALVWAALEERDPIGRQMLDACGLNERTLDANSTDAGKVMTYLQTLLSDDRSLLDPEGLLRADWEPKKIELTLSCWLICKRRGEKKAQPPVSPVDTAAIDAAFKDVAAQADLKNAEPAALELYEQQTQNLITALSGYKKPHKEMQRLVDRFTHEARLHRGAIQKQINARASEVATS